MAPSSFTMNSIGLFTVFMISGAHGVNIQFIRHHNVTGFQHTTNSTGSCYNTSSDKREYNLAIRTDTCFIAYSQPNCKSAFNQKYVPGHHYISQNELGRWAPIQSFHTCTDDEGGYHLNVDITTFNEYVPLPDVLESYKKVCSCVNVPQYIQNMSKWSINNHQNDLLAYFEQDCSGDKFTPMFISAGTNPKSRNMHLLEKMDRVTNKTYKIQSFGPDPNSTYFKTSCKFVRAYQFVELQTQLEQTKRNQETFQGDVLKQQKQEIDKQTEIITQLKQQVGNLTALIKSDLHELFA